MGTGTRISRRSASGGDDCYFHLDIWRRRRRCSANSYVHKCAHGYAPGYGANGCAATSSRHRRSHDGPGGHRCACSHNVPEAHGCARSHDGSGGHGDASSYGCATS